MKKSMSFLCLLFVGVVSLQAQNNPVLSFERQEIDYGNIALGSDGTRVVRFRNTGNAPLIIIEAKGSCGCTVPQWPAGPVMPRETGKITVKYDTNRLGSFSKEITIETNEPTSNFHKIYVKGTVVEAANASAGTAQRDKE